MNLRRPFIPTLILLLLPFILLACSPDPEIIVVEITRLVPEIEQVEVTRLVEIEKEVTRIVEVTPQSSSAPNTAVSVPDLDSLQIEFWPDYDQPAVLVLLTGSLPAGVPLPLEVAIPVPGDAQINAVAQIDESGMASIDYQAIEGGVLFQATTPAFRVEYYAPYHAPDGRSQNQRAYDYQWLAPFSVNELAIQIQRPANAADLTIQPQPAKIVTDPADGLDYYHLDPLAVPPAAPYNLTFTYTMTSDTLTIDELTTTPPDLPGSPLHDQQVNYH